MRRDDDQLGTLFVRDFKDRLVGMANPDLNLDLDAGGLGESVQFLQRGMHGLLEGATRQFDCCPTRDVLHHVEQNNLGVAGVLGSGMLVKRIDFRSVTQVDRDQNGFVQ